MLVDPQIQALLDKGTGASATHTLPVDVARTQYEVRIALMAPPADIGSFRERTIEGPGWRAEHPHLFRRAAAGMDPVGALP